MDRIYLFLIRNDVWIYIVSAVGLVWYLIELIRAQRQLRRAMFNIERETATRVRNNALSFVVFFAAVIGVIYLSMPVLPRHYRRTCLSRRRQPRTSLPCPCSSPTPLAVLRPPATRPANDRPAPTVTLPAELGGPVRRNRYRTVTNPKST